MNYAAIFISNVTYVSIIQVESRITDINPKVTAVGNVYKSTSKQSMLPVFLCYARLYQLSFINMYDHFNP